MPALPTTIVRAVLAAAWLLCAGAAHASDMAAVEAFYKGRTITLVSGVTPDGGDEQQERIFSGMSIVARDDGPAPGPGRDATSRLVARHLGHHLPGAPRVSVVTLPGAAGRRAARHLADSAARDGSAIGALERGLAIGLPTDAYGWIGAFGPDTGLLVVRRDAGIDDVAVLRKRELVVGATAPQDESARLARGLNEALGLKLRVIGGYRGIGALHQAFERGEVSAFAAGHAGDTQTSLIAWLQSGTAFALLQLGPRGLPWLADTPLAASLAFDSAERAALERLFAPQRLGLAYVTPPGVPAERLAALQAGFAAMVKDDAFVKDATTASVATPSIDGAALAQLVSALNAGR